jgi:hypothetical protein
VPWLAIPFCSRLAYYSLLVRFRTPGRYHTGKLIMKLPFHGGCHCGAVRYTCSEAPQATLHCHCIDCQKTTGSSFATELLVAAVAVEVTGPLCQYAVKADSGHTLVRKRCESCGSPVMDSSTGFPDHVALRAGGLDDPSWVQPQAHIWISRKQPWLMISDGLPQFEHDLGSAGIADLQAHGTSANHDER